MLYRIIETLNDNTTQNYILRSENDNYLAIQNDFISDTYKNGSFEYNHVTGYWVTIDRALRLKIDIELIK